MHAETIGKIIAIILEEWPQLAMVLFGGALGLSSGTVLKQVTGRSRAALRMAILREQMDSMRKYRDYSFDITLQAFKEAYKLDSDDELCFHFRNVIHMGLDAVEKKAEDFFRRNGFHEMSVDDARIKIKQRAESFILTFKEEMAIRAPKFFGGLDRDKWVEKMGTPESGRIHDITSTAVDVLTEGMNIAKKYYGDKKLARKLLQRTKRINDI